MDTNGRVEKIEDLLNDNPSNKNMEDKFANIEKEIEGGANSQPTEEKAKKELKNMTENTEKNSIPPSAALIQQASMTIESMIKSAKHSATIIAMLTAWIFTADELLRAINMLIEAGVYMDEPEAFRKIWKAYLTHVIKTSLALASAKIALAALKYKFKDTNIDVLNNLIRTILPFTINSTITTNVKPMDIINIFGPVSIIAIIRYHNQYAHTLIAIAKLLFKTGGVSPEVGGIIKKANTVTSLTDTLIHLTSQKKNQST